MLSVDFLLTSRESAVREKIEALNTSSLLNCYINQKHVSKHSERGCLVAQPITSAVKKGNVLHQTAVTQVILLHAHMARCTENSWGTGSRDQVGEGV